MGDMEAYITPSTGTDPRLYPDPRVVEPVRCWACGEWIVPAVDGIDHRHDRCWEGS